MSLNGEEIWKTIPGLERYEASSHGRIRFGPTGKIRKLKIHRTHHGKEYLVFSVDSGHKTCGGNRRFKNIKVGRIILLTFVGPAPPGKPLCGHKDDNGFNNCLDNLVWISNADNQAERVNPLCGNCPCRQDVHHWDTGECHTENCECSGWIRKKKKSLLVWNGTQ